MAGTELGPNRMRARETESVNGNVTPGGRKGTWRLRVPLGRDVVTGRYRTASRTVVASSRREAVARLNDFAREVRAENRARTDTTVADLFDRWLALSETRLSPTTMYTYRGYVRRDVAPAFGDLAVKDVTAEHLDNLYLALGERGMAAKSVRQVHAICRRAFAQAVKWRWLDVNPAVFATPPPVRQAQLQPPTPAAIRAMVDVAMVDDPALGRLVLMAAVTGARRGELCALRWSDVDLETGTVTIGRALIDVAGHVVAKDTKTHAERTIALPAEMVVELEAHRGWLEARAAAGEARLSSAAFVWPAPTSLAGLSPWRPDQVTGAFRRLAERVGVAARLHDLRHAHITQLLTAGVDIRTVSGRAGHANPSTTLAVYSHWMPAADRAAADVAGGLMRGESR